LVASRCGVVAVGRAYLFAPTIEECIAAMTERLNRPSIASLYTRPVDE
jgi:hypothetical protein